MECWHMSGAGNDFMVIDARGLSLDFPRLTVDLCKLTGADGFMAVDYSDCADFRLHFYNSDGSRGEMCGNGSRCICKFAFDHGIAGDTMTVETDAGIVSGWRLGAEQFQVKLNNPGVLDLHRLGEIAYVELGNPGVPHAVEEVPGLMWSDKEKLRAHAAALRYSPAFPKGANVNFYTWLAPDRLRVLTYERGVEDYTLACGTGCGSITSCLFAQNKLPGGNLTLENEGGTLTFHAEGENGMVTSLLMQGPAVVLKTYDIDPEPYKLP